MPRSGHEVGVDRHDPKIVAREQRWKDDISRRLLPKLLSELLASPTYGLTAGRPLPPEVYGVYLLSERGPPSLRRSSRPDRPLTACWNALLELPHEVARTFTAAPLGGHLCVYARRQEVSVAPGYHLKTAALRTARTPSSKAESRTSAKSWRRMAFQMVEINDNRLAAVFEIYAAWALGLHGQTFAVS